MVACAQPLIQPMQVKGGWGKKWLGVMNEGMGQWKMVCLHSTSDTPGEAKREVGV